VEYNLADWMAKAMYPRFGLVLMLTHACNLRCSYCYTGEKPPRSMEAHVGTRAIDRALASMEEGGTLELSLFGGEPVLEAGMVEGWWCGRRRGGGL